MKRRLSAVEHMIDANIVYMVRLEGHVEPNNLHAALLRVQSKHPALRVVIREAADGLYYEQDSSIGLPLRVVPRESDHDYQRECQTELNTIFPYDRPQFRAVWLPCAAGGDLLLTTSHRICDGMSMLTIVKEVLRALYVDEELISYLPVTALDLIGDYQHPKPKQCRMKADAVNLLLKSIPNSKRPPKNKELHLEWEIAPELLQALKRRCKAEGVSIHSVLAVTLDRSLLSIFGKKRTPDWIESPMDARRGRATALKSDMVFFGGGSFKVRTGRTPTMSFWENVRLLQEETNKQIEKEVLEIPGRYYFQEMLDPLKKEQVNWVVQLGDKLKLKGSWNRFALSNLGNITIDDGDAPFRVKDLRIYMHSFNVRLLCLIIYTFHGKMRFCCLGDEKCLSHKQAAELKREFTAIIQSAVRTEGGGGRSNLSHLDPTIDLVSAILRMVRISLKAAS